MPMLDYKTESRKSYGTSEPGNLTITQLQLGAILRIADAVEAMSKNFLQMQNDLIYYKNKYNEKGIQVEKQYKVISTLKGHITRLKKEKECKLPASDVEQSMNSMS